MKKIFPTLYKLTSTGKVQTWKIEVSPNKDDSAPAGAILTTYGLFNGLQQNALEVISEGKNIGKSNETTPFEQAVLEAQSQWEKKVKKGYVQNIEDAQEKRVDTNVITGGIEPMLAHSYDKQGHKIKFPAYVQPKLDGHRCIAIIQDGKCTLWSRTRKRITGVPHIERALEAANSPFGTIVIDGELYNHDYRDNFEDLTSLIRQVTPKPGHEKVQFWMYDVVTDEPFEERLTRLRRVKSNETIVVVATNLVESEEEMITAFGTYIEFGFEGLMVRNTDGRYKHGRSYDLLKVKVFADAEYKVIDVTSGRGKMEGLAMFHCVTEDGKEFRVKMVGKLDDLKHYLDSKDDYIGRQLTVKYQNLSSDGIPRFPVAMRFREDV